ncbi:MAG: hypothetical protein C0605_15900 [Hyphomicrobiales bacterium]|nr:MAG: hypothetical protein C0605_15900 [Hyphomicrobiales bacterium]
MPSALTRIGLWKMTANMLGETALGSVDDDSRIARLLRDEYDQARDAELRKHHWNFAVRRAALAADAEAPAFGWARAFTLPSDYIALLPLTEDGSAAAASLPYALEGGRLLSDAPAPLRIRYVARETREGMFDPLFADALAAMLALRIGHTITGKASYMDRANRIYERAVLEARLNDAIESPFLHAEPSEYEMVRYS